MQIIDGWIVSNFVVQVLKNDPITVSEDGLQTRSFRFVSDKVEAFAKFVGTEDHNTGLINLGNLIVISVKALAEMIAYMTDSYSIVECRELSIDDPKQRLPDMPKAREKSD